MRNKFYGSQKYGQKRVSHAGYSFASKLEAAVFDYLKRLEEAGDITELNCQKRVYLLKDPDVIYIPDFCYLRDGVMEYAEAKGMETDSWKIKKRLWEHFGPGRLDIFKGSYKSFKIVESMSKGKQCK